MFLTTLYKNDKKVNYYLIESPLSGLTTLLKQKLDVYYTSNQGVTRAFLSLTGCREFEDVEKV